ncbi:hypothetical protein FALBO_7956 [Fusarium albosuccineum]|uniref:Uncharacterized protein n=1 Tax=Fusarium albosuccineum TaxID=1237068 RepID=A0A8H4LBU7_9HYPO|nr:hypothetical protein FALBO_7956 [Fusarium albosuccineum]
MADAPAPSAPSPPHVASTPSTEIYHLVQHFRNRNRFLSEEKDSLLQKYRALSEEIAHNKIVISWQHRSVTRAGQFIDLLETVTQAHQGSGSQQTQLSRDERVGLSHQISSSPLSTPPELLSQGPSDPVMLGGGPTQEQGQSWSGGNGEPTSGIGGEIAVYY